MRFNIWVLKFCYELKKLNFVNIWKIYHFFELLAAMRLFIIRFTILGIIVIEIISLFHYGKEQYECRSLGFLYVIYHAMFIPACLYFFVWSLFISSYERIVERVIDPAKLVTINIWIFASIPTFFDMLGILVENHHPKNTPLVIVPWILNTLTFCPLFFSAFFICILILYFVSFFFFGNIFYTRIKKNKINNDSFIVISYGNIKEIQNKVNENCLICHERFNDDSIVQLLKCGDKIHENCDISVSRVKKN
ncbi:MAG: hypothetical protein Harvfovirus20_5 [Harvfovirus sp.]|uniref:Uncharacterized protein n=1 Tax=Harvfovirus sp. TaxID=2487768 RepID=A0A3G5A1S6_9VIRU|nr:MAG: hypothetical protein Harvfovirus20_5 [Harvfovirus sp.]